MALFPSGRTSPTIKQLATGQSLDGRRGWEIRLGAPHAVVLLGIVTGSMVCAFYLGLASGQRAGFENAQAALLANTAKLPIPDEFRDGDSLKGNASEIYAKLSDDVQIGDLSGGAGTDQLPEVGTIKSVSEAPIVADLAKEAMPEKNIGGATLSDLIDQSEQLPSLDNSGSLAALTKPGPDSPKTLGALATAPSKSTKAEVVVQSQEKVTVAKLIETPPAKSTASVVTKKVETPPAATTAPSNSLIREVLPGGWYAQVAAPKQTKEAEHLSNKLKTAGFPVVIEKASVRGEQYFRILVGPEGSRQRAQILVQQLKGESFVRGEPFLRLVR